MVLVEDTPSPSATIAIRRTTFTGGVGDPLTFDVHPHLDLTIEDVDISDVDARESGIVILADEGRAILRRVSIGAVGADSSPAMFIDGGSIPFAPPPRRPSFLTIEDSVIAGNTFITDVNDVIRTDPAWWAMGFHNVDFGTGPDANQPHDFVNCPDYSGIQSGYMTVNHPCL